MVSAEFQPRLDKKARLASKRPLLSLLHCRAISISRALAGWLRFKYAALSSTTLGALRLLAANWTNYRGINTPIDLTGAKLIFPSDLHTTVMRLLSSELAPGTGNNDTNEVRLAQYTPVEEPRLTSTTAYFIPGRRHGLLSNPGLFPRPIRYVENNGSLVHGVEFA